MCETFGKKRACYGLTDVGKGRWCAGCANKQPGETELVGARINQFRASTATSQVDIDRPATSKEES